jgi:DNA repair protein RadC
MNRQLAARGIGGGNLSSLLSMANSNRMGDQLMRGQQGINNQAMGFGMQSAQLANQGFGQAGNLYSNAQNRLLNAATTNAGMLNEGTQFGMMSNYNQALTNQQRRADLMSNVLGAGASIIGGM